MGREGDEKDYNYRHKSDRDSRQRYQDDGGVKGERRSRKLDKDRDRDRHKDRNKQRDRDRNRDRHRDRDRERDDVKERSSRSHHHESKKYRKRSRSRSRSFDNESGNDSRKESRRSSSHRKSHKSNRHQKRDSKKRDDSKQKRKHRSSDSDRHESSSSRRKKNEKDKPKSILLDEKDLHELGPIYNKPPSSLLDMEQDYFAFHSYLRVYLYRIEHLYFEDLTSEKSRHYFEIFVQRYNAGQLPTIFYDSTLPPEILEDCKRTKHQWTFKTTKGESATLDIIKAGVRKQTEYNDNDIATKQRQLPSICTVIENPSTHHKSNYSEENSRHSSMKTKEEKAIERVANRRLRDHVRTTHEELGVSEKPMTGYERMQEKKRQQSDKQQSGFQMKEEMAGGAELNDSDIYGEDDHSSFQKALARQRQHYARRKEQKSSRIEELQNKEEERKKAMLDMLGLSHVKPGAKITIAPRKD